MRLQPRHPLILSALTALGLCNTATSAQPIQHDAEHYMLLAQHGERWAQEDKAIAAKLEAVRDANSGKRPNILFVLIDDVGFGEMGDPVLNHVRGYTTPNINSFARESLTFSRMYSEPTCTPTRTALLTGRLPVRSHMLEPKIVPPEGTGLHKDEVTLAELLKKAGYNTAHIGKWHQGDIKQALPHNQGFDTASFPLHNQATFNFMTIESEEDQLAPDMLAVSVGERERVVVVCMSVFFCMCWGSVLYGVG